MMLLRLNPGTEAHFARPLVRRGPCALAILALLAASAMAQVPPRLAPPPTPNFNPSSPLVVPQAPPVPVSPVTPGTLPGSTPSDVNVSGPYSIMAAEPRERKPVRHQHRHSVHRHPAAKHGGTKSMR
jgi:hypothetical protein